MIFNSENINKILDGQALLVYAYEIEAKDENPPKSIQFLFNKETLKILVYKVEAGVEPDQKEFDATATGFDEATDYFESLILKETSPQNQNQENQNTQPPIGFLFNQPNDSIKVLMQDGRKGDFTSFDFVITDNVLKFTKTKNGFENNEKYYVDIIPDTDKPNMFALYPVGEEQGGVNQELDDYSGKDLKEATKQQQQAKEQRQQGGQGGEQGGQGGEQGGQQGGEQGGQGGQGGQQGGDGDGDGSGGGQGGQQGGNGDGDGSGGGQGGNGRQTDNGDNQGGGQGGDENANEDQEPTYTVPTPTAQQILAKTYNMQELTDLLYNFGGKENLLNDLLNFTEMEKSGLLRKFGTEYQNDRQYESIIRSVIND
jgi:hypothetical protein